MSGLQGMVVSNIAFRGLSGVEPGVLLEQIAQKTNEPLDRSKIRTSIQTLYATGRFSSIAVEAERTQQNQVTLVFVADENYFVGTITVEGLPKQGPTQNQMANASKLSLGELFTHENVEESYDRMKKVMEDHGYYESKISSEEVPHPDTRQMDVTFYVEPGDLARVGEVTVKGDPGYSEAEFRNIAKMHSGDKIRAEYVTRALTRLRKKYQKQKRLESQVSLVERKYHEDSNLLDYTFEVERGAVVDIQVEGAKISPRVMKRYIPVYEENAVDDDLLNEGRRNLRDYFQTQGFFDAKVAFRRQLDAERDRLHIIYAVDKGERHKLERVVLDGNKYFNNETIRERMLVQPADLLMRHGRFSQSMLVRDEQAIRDLYQANGFDRVQVKSEVRGNASGEGDIVVRIHIDEGPQTKVNSLVIAGNNSVPDTELREMLTTAEGQPFSNFNVATDRDVVVTYYFNRGFSNVSFEPTETPHDGDPTRMDVVFTIKEGEQSFVDRVLVSGLYFTKPHIVDREIQSKPGDPLSQAKMLESQRRLYDLGIFNEVSMAVQNPDGVAERKNLLYEIREAKRYTFNYGLGLEVATGANQAQGTSPQGETGVSPRVSFDVTRINFRGRDQSIIFKSRLGRLQRRALLSFDQPRWFDLQKWRFTLSAFYDNTRDVNTFASERLEASTQLNQTINKSTTMLYRYSYRRVKVDPNSFPTGFTPDNIPLFSKPVRVGIPSVTFIRDRRDDPIDATKGSYTTADLGVASGIFGSEADFGRVLLQNSTYYRFKKKYVLARNTRIGVESPYSNSQIVPLPERFFEGGGNSLRGFAINQAGPRDPQTGTPVGGNAMFVNNIELRLPPMTLPIVQQNLSLVIFHDMGNVFNEGTDMLNNLLRFKQKNRQNCFVDSSTPVDPSQPVPVCDFNFVSHAVGAGIRYHTPIGPVRVDIGYNLNPALFPVRQGTAAVPAHSETIKHFNFFFSIGQTF
jgi:outer membrane protein insertion porin family